MLKVHLELKPPEDLFFTSFLAICNILPSVSFGPHDIPTRVLNIKRLVSIVGIYGLSKR